MFGDKSTRPKVHATTLRLGKKKKMKQNLKTAKHHSKKAKLENNYIPKLKELGSGPKCMSGLKKGLL